jgi:hypothetical protein
MIKIPIGRRSSGLTIRRSTSGLDGRLIRDDFRTGDGARRSAELSIVLIATEKVTEGKDHPKQYNQQDKDAHQVASSEHPIASAPVA